MVVSECDEVSHGARVYLAQARDSEQVLVRRVRDALGGFSLLPRRGHHPTARLYAMASFASSPAPRRTVARHTPTRQSPPVRRRRASQTPGPSRLATPHIARHHDRLSSVRDDESERSGMDVDDDDEIRGLKPETIFAKSPELTATFYSHLPVEVKQVLKSAGELVDVSILACSNYDF